MEQNIVINIGVFEALGIIGTVIASVTIGAWRASSRLTKVETKVDIFERRLTNVEGRLDNAFASGSPVALLPKGQMILEESGLKKYIDEKKDDLLIRCKSRNAMMNPYDIQDIAFKFFDQLDFGDLEAALKTTAFRQGVSLDTVKRIGGIYFRDICLTAHGFKPEDLDKTKVSR